MKIKRDGTKVVLLNVRCSYVYIEKPRIKNEKEAGYGVQPLIPKAETKVISELRAAIKEAAQSSFGKDVKMSRLKTPLRDADEEEFDGEEYKDMMFFNANSSKQPRIVVQGSENATQEQIQEYAYSGAYFHLSINFYGYEKDGSRGVAAGLNNVMLYEHGERLGGAVSRPEDDFADADVNKDLVKGKAKSSEFDDADEDEDEDW